MNHFNLDPRPHQIDATAFVAGNATIIGDVWVGRDSSIWFGAVIRGDVESIRIGNQTNIQDNAVVHGDPGIPCQIGDRVTVGHAAIVHGATVDDDVLIGMRSVLLNNVRVGSGSVIAAGTLVPENTVIPPNSLVMGVPGKIRGQTTDVHRQMIVQGTQHYVAAGQAYRNYGKPD